MVLVPAEITAGLSAVLDSRTLVAGDRRRGLPQAVPAMVHLMMMMMTMILMMMMVHPEHRFKHRRKRLFPEDDVARPKIPRGDEVATSFGRELKVDTT